jgi:capsular polysaccharide biosynthesis protein/Mrp family chromosome partitioning ATPase
MDVTDAVAAERQRVVGFADVIRIPLRRWRTVLGVAAGITLVVLAYLQFVPATYKATAVVVLRPVVTDPFTYPSGGADRAINMTAENGIAASNEVIDATAKIVQLSAEDTRDALTIEVPTGGQVLRFEYAGSSEDQAVIGANAAAETYLKVREKIYQEQRAALLLSYDNTIRLVTEQRRKAQKELPEKLNSDTSSPSIQAVLDQVRALNDQVAQLANQRAKIGSADLSPGAVTAAARAPATSSHDAALLFIVGGILGGTLLGMLAAHVREVFDRRIRSVEQAADLTGLPALGVVRSARSRGAHGALADARYIALAVGQWVDQPDPPPLVVISGRADEGRTQVAGGLAVAMAEAGHDVYLGGAVESHDELRAILFAAQRRTPPLPRISLTDNDEQEPDTSADIADTVVIHVPGSGSANGTAPGARPSGTPFTPGPGGLSIGAASSFGAGAGAPGVTRVAERGATPVPPVVSPESQADSRRPLAVLIGAGSVRLGPPGASPPGSVAVIDAPPADTDERGVRAARSGVAVLVIGRDTTRDRELSRLLDRLRSAGARTVGFVLTGGNSA